MKNKYGIGIFVLLFMFIYLISYGAYHEAFNKENSSKNKSSNELIQPNHMSGFYLYEKNGYVVVYESDKITPFEYTNILYEDLPDLMKQEIRNGKYMKNAEELYGFLENYTS